MIRLSFITANREIINFEIENKNITYKDKIWKDGIRFIPKDTKFIRKLICNRNKFPASKLIMQWINESNSGKNLEEYNNAKTDEELSKIILKEANSKGLLEIKKVNK